MLIRLGKKDDYAEWLKMRMELWPLCEIAVHEQEMKEMIENLKNFPVFVAEEESRIIGFIEASVHSLTTGNDIHNIGYIEGWFIRKEERRKGYGKLLIQAVEEWAKENGFKEVGSDAEISNAVSILAHQKLGYILIGEDIHEVKFMKKLNITINNK